MGSGFARSHPTDEVSPERSPGRGRVVLVAVLAMIAAAAGGGIAYALLGQDARPAGSDRAGATDTTASHESAPVADPADEQDQPKEDVTDDGGAGSRPIRCWDHDQGDALVGSVAECSWPRGERGMRWVFGRIAGCQDETGTPRTDAIEERPSINRAFSADCYVRVGERLVRVHYSGWQRWGPMERYYRNLEGVPLTDPAGRADVVVTQVVSPNADFKVAFYYRNRAAPWSVTVYTDSEADYLRVYNHLIIRREDLLRGVPGRRLP